MGREFRVIRVCRSGFLRGVGIIYVGSLEMSRGGYKSI